MEPPLPVLVLRGAGPENSAIVSRTRLKPDCTSALLLFLDNSQSNQLQVYGELFPPTLGDVAVVLAKQGAGGADS